MAATSLTPIPFVFDESILSNLVSAGEADFPAELVLAEMPKLNADEPVVVVPVAQALDSFLQPVFKDIFYARIHFTPTPFDFGTVISTETHTVSVWNAFESEAKMLTAITIGATPDNTTLLTTLPLELAALEAKPVDFQVGGIGQLSLAGTMLFEFDGGPAPTLFTAGSRSALFHFEHNWSVPVRERLVWDTDILKAESGREQRRQRRQYPKRYLTHNYAQLNARDFETLRRALWRDQRSRLITPCWANAPFVAQDIAQSASAAYFDTTGYDLDEGAAVMLYEREGVYETLVIDSVYADHLVFTGSTTRAWPAGTRLVPLRRAFLGSELSYNEVTQTVGTADIEFLITNEQASLNRFPAHSLSLYRNLPLLLEENEASDLTSYSLAMNEAIQHEPFGIYDKTSIGLRPTESFTFRWVCLSQAEINACLALLGYCKGRYKPFWLFTWGHNCELAADIAQNVSQIIVSNWGYASSYNVDPSRRDIAIRLHDGRIFPRRITEVLPGLTAETERLALDQPIPFEIPVAQVDRISLLRYCRLGADEVELEWHASGLVAKLPLLHLDISE